MKLYHLSNVIVEFPDTLHSRNYLDEETLFDKLIGWMDNLHHEIKYEVSSLV